MQRWQLYTIPVIVVLPALGWLVLQGATPETGAKTSGASAMTESPAPRLPTTADAVELRSRLQAAIAEAKSDVVDLSKDYIRDRFVSDVAPVATDCYQTARNQAPQLEVRIDVELTVIGDPDLGAVVQDLEIIAASDGADSALTECIVHAASTLMLPAPAVLGAGRGRFTFLLAPPEQP